ncbi:polyprenyl synthetase family protein [Amphibacillus jilinensis]|uniref:polyprenyl synthetase family protein n=1 Tax=Amphibacillus jilinensis TaxID=1216008 RepID=UPI000307C90C|nr:polyprenyl synthetase family protein [Amphibacillus jilinensis]
MHLPKQYSYLQMDVDCVNKQLHDALSESDHLIKDVSLDLLEAGGKRIRPLLCLTASYFGERKAVETYKLATILELIHMASLIHDDIIDHAVIRRSRSTVHFQYSKLFATYTGDYLFALALELTADIEVMQIHQLLASTVTQLSIGELNQLHKRYIIDISLKNYLRKIRDKTARLIATCCQIGAIAAQSPKTVNNNLYWFGYFLGMAYQITDDISDFTDTQEQTGKPQGQDLIEGYLTLPTLLAMRDKKVYDHVQYFFKQGQSKSSDISNDVVNRIKQTNAVNEALVFSHWYLDKAVERLKQLPNQPEKQLLMQMVAYLRKKNNSQIV